MMKKLFLAFLPLLLQAAPLPAQEAGGKVLVVLTEFPDDLRFDFGLARALQFKQAGLDVHVMFENSAVLCFLDLRGELSKPGWKKKAKDVSDARAKVRANEDFPRSHQYRLAGKKLGLPPPLKALLQKFLDLKIPYTVSSAAAKNYMVLDELKAAGEPLSKEPDSPPDISGFLQQGYRTVIY